MITIRRANERGHADFGWLDSRHTFSFGEYMDRQFMGFGPLRVINEDNVAAGKGFGAHSHQNMEIISYVIKGALEHKDSLGTGSVLVPGDVQRMSAGTGVRHSEFNHSDTDTVHFLQIWLIPERPDIQPSYEEKRFSAEQKQGQLRLVGSRDGRQGSVTIGQDVNLYASVLKPDDVVSYEFEAGRLGWLQLITGRILINQHLLEAGDGVSITATSKIDIISNGESEFLLFDMAPMPNS